MKSYLCPPPPSSRPSPSTSPVAVRHSSLCRLFINTLCCWILTIRFVFSPALHRSLGYSVVGWMTEWLTGWSYFKACLSGRRRRRHRLRRLQVQNGRIHALNFLYVNHRDDEMAKWMVGRSSWWKRPRRRLSHQSLYKRAKPPTITLYENNYSAN